MSFVMRSEGDLKCSRGSVLFNDSEETPKDDS